MDNCVKLAVICFFTYIMLEGKKRKEHLGAALASVLPYKTVLAHPNVNLEKSYFFKKGTNHKSSLDLWPGGLWSKIK